MRDLDRRDFLRLLGAGALGLALPERALLGAPARRPNIVVMLVDDLGYGEVGVYGGSIPTPNIDSIAKAGVRFTDGYVSCPVCAPTRAGLNSGRYQQRFGFEFNPGPNVAANFGLPREQKTLAERLQAEGYITGMVGKWHLGERPGLVPTDRGFAEYFGFLGGADAYVPPRPGAIMRGTQVVEEPDYLTDAFAREAVAFIDRHASEPFFLYFAPNAVHGPLQAPPKYLDRFRGVADANRRTFSAMLSALDEAVGRVMGALRTHGLEEDTLVFFLSDNGGPTTKTTSGNGPLRGYKAQTWEGGIRVPFMVQWKGRIPAGQTFSQPVISLDIHATALAAVGKPAPGEWGLDGVDLMPYLTGAKAGSPHDRLFWRFGQQRAVRMGDWKLTDTGTGWQLYNLAEDVGESRDQAAGEPVRVKELAVAWNQWEAGLEDPRWRQAGAARPWARQRRRRGLAG